VARQSKVLGETFENVMCCLEELPPSLITPVKKLDAVEDNQLSEELSPHSCTLLRR